MPFAEFEWMGNTALDFVLAGIAALVVILVVPLVRGYARSYSEKHRYIKHIRPWNVLAYCLSKTIFPVILVFAVYAASEFLTLPANLQKFLNVTVILFVFLQVALWVNAVVDLYARSYEQKMEVVEGERSTALYLISFFAKSVLIALVLLVALDQLGVNVTTFIAGLGVGGIAVALAVQNILGDLFASLTIVLDKPFKVGDFLVVGDMAGTVERVGLKTTRVKSLSGEQIVFSNNDLLQSRIRNYKKLEERRILFSFGVLYETPIEKLRKLSDVTREIIESIENTRFDRANFLKFGASSLDFEVVYFVLNPSYNVYMDIQEKINLALFEKFKAMDVEFAYPTQKIYAETKLVTVDKDEERKPEVNPPL